MRKRLAIVLVVGMMALMMFSGSALAAPRDGGQAPGCGPDRHAAQGLRTAIRASDNNSVRAEKTLRGLFSDARRDRCDTGKPKPKH